MVGSTQRYVGLTVNTFCLQDDEPSIGFMSDAVYLENYPTIAVAILYALTVPYFCALA